MGQQPAGDERHRARHQDRPRADDGAEAGSGRRGARPRGDRTLDRRPRAEEETRLEERVAEHVHQGDTVGAETARQQHESHLRGRGLYEAPLHVGPREHRHRGAEHRDRPRRGDDPRPRPGRDLGEAQKEDRARVDEAGVQQSGGGRRGGGRGGEPAMQRKRPGPRDRGDGDEDADRDGRHAGQGGEVPESGLARRREHHRDRRPQREVADREGDRGATDSRPRLRSAPPCSDQRHHREGRRAPPRGEEQHRLGRHRDRGPRRDDGREREERPRPRIAAQVAVGEDLDDEGERDHEHGDDRSRRVEARGDRDGQTGGGQDRRRAGRPDRGESVGVAGPGSRDEGRHGGDQQRDHGEERERRHTRDVTCI